MSDAQEIYDQYVNKYETAPKLPRHLVAFAKKCGQTLKYTGAKQIIASNASKPIMRLQSSKNVISESSNTEIKDNDTNEPKYETNSEIVLTNNDEKETQQSSEMECAQPIMCRVNFECSTEQAKQEIMSALALFVQIQRDKPHPGTITYHFCCPNPEKYPLKLEFIELYYDEKVYWAHGKYPKFGSAFFKAFKDENRRSRLFITCGDHFSEYVRKVNGGLDSTFPGTDAGFLLNDKYLECLDKVNDTKIMFKLEITAPKYHKGKKENVGLILSMINKLSVYAKELSAVMFHCHRIDQKIYPDRLELISIWPRSEYLVGFLSDMGVESIVNELQNLMIEFTEGVNETKYCLCELYGGQGMDEVMGFVEYALEDIAVVKQVQTDVGYILHEKANSKYLK